MKRSRPSLKRILTRQYVLLACVPLLLVCGAIDASIVAQQLRRLDPQVQIAMSSWSVWYGTTRGALPPSAWKCAPKRRANGSL